MERGNRLAVARFKGTYQCAGNASYSYNSALVDHETAPGELPCNPPSGLNGCLALLEQGSQLQQKVTANGDADWRPLAALQHPSPVDICPHKSKSSRPAQPAAASQEMGKGQKVLEGRSQQERRKIRKEKGSLKNLTLQPRTRIRYDKAKKRFYSFLSTNSLELPTQCYQLDGLLVTT
jgi:hypothetical protein